MKLTLSQGGGITGLGKEFTVDVRSLDDDTRKSLMAYFRNNTTKALANFNEYWSLDDEEEVPINKNRMDDKLRDLYNSMRQQLDYPDIQ